jgi:uncharacterized SAM-dependent methyltransferase
MNRATAIALPRVGIAELAEVRAGLLASPKTLPPKFFYDARGSELFEQITRLPEYYLTRAEREILVAWMPELVARLGPRTLVELGADFDPSAFRHHACYREAAHRIEMHLVATRDQRVAIPGIGPIEFLEGESVRTEISCKYDRATAAAMFGDAGLHLAEWRTDAAGRFALALAAPCP